MVCVYTDLQEGRQLTALLVNLRDLVTHIIRKLTAICENYTSRADQNEVVQSRT
jgi:hypothetical protein